MKYIDRFKNISEFLDSSIQQITGDRIVTIEGHELPILKKKMKTVITIDPSTNQEVEVEELQDVWMVPIGEEETKIEHKYSFHIIDTQNQIYFDQSISRITFYIFFDDFVDNDTTVDIDFNNIRTVTGLTLPEQDEKVSETYITKYTNYIQYTLILNNDITTPGIYSFFVPLYTSDMSSYIPFVYTVNFQKYETLPIQLADYIKVYDGGSNNQNNQYIGFNKHFYKDNQEHSGYASNGNYSVVSIVPYNNSITVDNSNNRIFGKYGSVNFNNITTPAGYTLTVEFSYVDSSILDNKSRMTTSNKMRLQSYYSIGSSPLSIKSSTTSFDITSGNDIQKGTDTAITLEYNIINKNTNEIEPLNNYIFTCSNPAVKSIVGNSDGSITMTVNIPTTELDGTYTLSAKAIMMNTDGFILTTPTFNVSMNLASVQS